MTTKEQQEYNALSERMKVKYSQIKSNHPDWSHAQIMCRLIIDEPPLELPGCIAEGSNEENSIWDKLKKIFK